jgi:Bacterial archaeo-eukaryotic release factor family 3
MSLLSIDELRTLAELSEYPSISLYMPTERAGAETQQNPIRFKNLLKQAEELLQAQEQMRNTDAINLLESITELDQDEFWQQQDQGLAIFLSKNFMRYYRLPLAFEELVVVSDRFHLKPLMPLLTNDGAFYLLALSQKQIRLFQGSRYGIDEIELEGIPTSVDAALQYDETAKEGQFRISTSRGGTNNSFQQVGSFHGQGSPDRDEPKKDILQFFHILDQGLQKYWHDKQIPLVLAGVEYLLPIYQEANTYPHLVNEIISAENIGTLTPKEVHQQAWAVVEPLYMQSQDAAIEHYHELAGTGKTSTDLKEAVAAAYYGRIDELFVAVGVQQWGNFDPQTNELSLHSEMEPGDEDLLNTAAVQTVLNGGTVYAMKPEQVPEQVPLAAVLRY